MFNYVVVLNNKNKIYSFYREKLEINDKVIVKTERGLEFGIIFSLISDSNVDDKAEIIRVASQKDYNIYMKNLKINCEAKKYAQSIADKLKLDMSFIDADLTFDGKQLMLHYTSAERVDFRELAKTLAGKYHIRIELRQIGIRDKAKLIGGIGVCGRELCCKTFLKNFDNISMNMAKNQNLSLNPSKINGVCGRLLCCLAYENDTYSEYRKQLPNVGDEVETVYGVGTVESVNVLNLTYRVNINGDSKDITIVWKQ